MRKATANLFPPSMERAILTMIVLSVSFKASTADPRTTVAKQFCNSSLAASGAVLANNFVPAMQNLSSLVDQKGFGTTVVGAGPNAVFALAQCQEDLSSVDCRLCFSEIRSQLPKCYPGTGGRIFLDGCFGRYENYSFFDDIRAAGDTDICSYGKNSSSPKEFAGVVRDVVGNVSSAAAAAQNTKGFAVWSASGSTSTVYALAQCWENLGNQLCKTCLDTAASSIVSCLPATQGRALYAGCYMRYSTELFWNVDQTTSNSSGKHKILWIILSSSLGIILLITGMIILKKRCFWSKTNAKSLRDLYGPGLSTTISESNLNFRYNELKKATNKFSPSNKLGQGSYGAVYMAILSNKKEVAVKRLFMNTRQWIDQFFNEVNLINRLRHKNLVKLLGCSVDGPESLLVYEYFYNRSLDLFIFDSTPDKHLNWQQRFDIIQGVAEGLSYLHEDSEIRIIHRDVKASNVLLDEKLKPKITDFGLARYFPEDHTHLSTGIAGTLGYMAPEYIVHGHLTDKADVYSFGVLTLEIVTAKRCSGAIGSHAGHFLLAKIWNHYKTNMVERIIDQSLLTSESAKDEILHVVRVGLMCIQSDPRNRPTMSRVVELLRSSRYEDDLILTDPPFLDVAMVNEEEGDVSRLLSTSYNPGKSRSSGSWLAGR